MAEVINVEDVTSANVPPEQPTTESVGQWHNWALMNHYKMVQQLKGNDSVDAYRQYCLNQNEKFVSLNMSPSTSAESVNRLFDVLANAPADAEFNTVIAQLQEIYAAFSTNETLRNTPVCIAANVGYYSAMFWSQVTVGTPGVALKIPQWIKIVCADIGGAFGGSAFGVIGAVIGGAAGSIGAG